jgi:3'-phosphoadenosine 5'-phosphosulfate sulfotransferase (PAPS reductase)/FAD synthetase
LAAPSAQVTAPRVAAEALRKLAERAQQRSPPAARPRPLTLRDVVAKPPPERPLFVVSDGIGVDSTAMLVGLWRLGFRPDVILHADTGDEHPATVAYREERRAWLRRVGFPDLTIVRRAPSRSKKSGLAFSTLGEKCIANATLPSLAFGGKACSVEWKIKPQEQWLKRFAPAQATWARGRNVVPRAL